MSEPKRELDKLGEKKVPTDPDYENRVRNAQGFVNAFASMDWLKLQVRRAKENKLS
jgi:hypothetical protein